MSSYGFSLGVGMRMTVRYGALIQGFPAQSGLMLPAALVHADIAPFPGLPPLRMPEAHTELKAKPGEVMAFKVYDGFYVWTEVAGRSLQVVAIGNGGLERLDALKQCPCNVKGQLMVAAQQALFQNTYAMIAGTCLQDRIYREVRAKLSRQERTGTVEGVVLSTEQHIWTTSMWAD